MSTYDIKKFNNWHSWKAMRSRCFRKRDKDYKSYGGKGITVDEKSWRWFKNFHADMGFRPTSKHSIDRIDNSKGYSKDNCRWATPKEQADNRRTKDECFKGHKWTKENTIIVKQTNSRLCRICYDNRAPSRYHRQVKESGNI